MVPHRVAKGDNLTKILKKKGVPLKDLPRYLEAVKEINDIVRDVNRIFAGTTILLPTEAYFAPTQETPSATAAEEPPKEAPVVALSRDVPPEPGPGIAEPARPEAQLRPPASPPAAAPVVETAKEPPRPETAQASSGVLPPSVE